MDDACRKAKSAYMRRYRNQHPEDYAYEKRMNGARNRALWRLARAHPDEFRAMVDEEAATA